jgi:hypothetical protein
MSARICTVCILVGALIPELLGRGVVTLLWLFPSIAVGLGALFAITGALTVYRARA